MDHIDVPPQQKSPPVAFGNLRPYKARENAENEALTELCRIEASRIRHSSRSCRNRPLRQVFVGLGPYYGLVGRIAGFARDRRLGLRFVRHSSFKFALRAVVSAVNCFRAGCQRSRNANPAEDARTKRKSGRIRRTKCESDRGRTHETQIRPMHRSARCPRPRDHREGR